MGNHLERPDAGIEPNKNIHNCLKTLLKLILFTILRIFVKPNFFHTLKLNQHIEKPNAGIDMIIQLSFIKPNVRDMQKCKTMPLFPLVFLNRFLNRVNENVTSSNM